MPARFNTHQNEELTHSLTSVRKHHINIDAPAPPKADEESFVIRVKGHGSIELSPRAAQQFLGCIAVSLAQITGQSYGPWRPVTPKPLGTTDGLHPGP